jgi:hypothetical protein
VQPAFRTAQQSLNNPTVLSLHNYGSAAPWIPSGDRNLGGSHVGARHVGDDQHRIKVRLADSECRRSSASYLIQRMYAWRGYATSPLSDDPNRMTLVAFDVDDIVATITVGLDADKGLLVDELYADEVDRLRSAGARVCEFTKLAVDRTQQSKELLAMLFHVAYIYAHKLKGFSDLVIEVNPRHVKFYERMLGFKAFGPERTNRRVNAPAILMRLELSHPEAQIALHGGKRDSADDKRSLYPYFFAPGKEADIAARLIALG